MSVVAAVRRHGAITIAADTLALFGEGMTISEENARASKLSRVGEAVIGGTGWAVYDDILEHYLQESGIPALRDRQSIYSFFLGFWRALRETYTLVNEQAVSKDTPFGDLDATFLIASPGGLYKVSSDLGVTEFQRFHAIGSGSEYALGAMHVLIDEEQDDQALVSRACAAAIATDASCGGSIDVFQVPCG